jgi:hypothetical protein
MEKEGDCIEDVSVFIWCPNGETLEQGLNGSSLTLAALFPKKA